MGLWQFRAVRPDWSIGDLDDAQCERITEYEKALRLAVTSEVARPDFSGFHVRSSMGALFNCWVQGGNVEYGFCQAQHSEEFAGAAYLAYVGRTGPLPVFGLAGRGVRSIPTPCGNCRDYLLDGFGPGLETVYGHPEGGVAMVIPLRQYLFDGYTTMQSLFSIVAQETFRQGQRCEHDAYSNPGIHPERRYSVRLMSRLSQPSYGGLDLACDFHPIYPVQDAIRAARRNGLVSLGQVLVVCEGHRPQVMYRDRQHLFEFNLMDELVLGEEQDPPVYLVQLREGNIEGAWRTSVKEWLPRPFSPSNFADMGRLTAYAKSKAGR